MSGIDRQFVASAAISAAAAALFLAALFLFVYRTGWTGALLVLSGFGAFFAWFYLGPRGDLPRGAGIPGPGGERP